MGQGPQVLYQEMGESREVKMRLSLSEWEVPIQERPRLVVVLVFWAVVEGGASNRMVVRAAVRVDRRGGGLCLEGIVVGVYECLSRWCMPDAGGLPFGCTFLSILLRVKSYLYVESFDERCQNCSILGWLCCVILKTKMNQCI
jgi:hypothetical protein